MTYRFIPHDAPPDAKGTRFKCEVNEHGVLRVELLDAMGRWQVVWTLNGDGLPNQKLHLFTLPHLDGFLFPEGTP